MRFEELASCELLVNGGSVASTNRGSQIVGAGVGAAVLGIPGMIVGGLSSSQSVSHKIASIELRVRVADLDKPAYSFKFLSGSGPGFDPGAVRITLDLAREWHARLQAIIEQGATAITADQKQLPLVADELAKLANLLKEGVLTEQEFQHAKARLLNS
jgi:hypothetical protein